MNALTEYGIRCVSKQKVTRMQSRNFTRVNASHTALWKMSVADFQGRTEVTAIEYASAPPKFNPLCRKMKKDLEVSEIFTNFVSSNNMK